MFIGVDESNHGRFPEIIVSCASTNKDYIKVKKFSKKRKKIESKRIKTFKGFPYKYMIFTENFGFILNRENYKTIAIGEFSRFYSKEGIVESIFMDGNIPEHQVEKIFEMLYEIDKRIEFCFGKDLDKKLKIVNEADNRANFLYRYYRDSPEKNKAKYLDYLLIPDLRKYEKFLI
ncbi:hypothetical protein COU58_01660 [Candidatus Pacearchaeota archaeon CG10_big_fil_rev_8_21_14_0_10_32_42]|nr:MAG: hypothetical protein COU58_01660 [Candidatus Pacearchaeota archaeon CG10_big_fil_rev_8_21_14_0_10_32_42]